jgi:hypothetical protein
MSAAFTGINIEQRSCFDLTLSIQRNGGFYNLSGVALNGEIRRDFDDALQATFDYEILNASEGLAKISLTSEQTESIDLSPCSWDLFADKSGECPDKLMYGPVYLIKNITKTQE